VLSDIDFARACTPSAEVKACLLLAVFSFKPALLHFFFFYALFPFVIAAEAVVLVFSFVGIPHAVGRSLCGFCVQAAFIVTVAAW